MRLIDADALIEEALTEGAYGYVDAKQIADAPTVDAAPVVCCKDCKYSYDDISGLYCSHGVCIYCIVPPNFYCPEGKRKEKE